MFGLMAQDFILVDFGLAHRIGLHLLFQWVLDVQSVVGKINYFALSCYGEKLECKHSASNSRLFSYLQVRQEPTCGGPLKGKIPSTFIQYFRLAHVLPLLETTTLACYASCKMTKKKSFVSLKPG
jgi:hypothetical protein